MRNLKQKAFAWILSSAIIFSGVPSSVIAEETEPQKVTEAQEPTEKQTEKPTEKQTEKPTEKQTEKPTEKQTEAATEKPAEAATEKQTEAATEPKAEEKPAEQATENTSGNTEETQSSSEQTAGPDDGQPQSEKEAEQTSSEESGASETESSSDNGSGENKEEQASSEATSFEVLFEVSEGAVVTVDGKEPENGKAAAKDGTIVFTAAAKEGYKISSVQVGHNKDLTAGEKDEYKVSGITADGTVITVKAEKEEAPIPDIKVEMQLVDEDGNIIGGSRTRELPVFEKELVLDDPEKEPFEIEYYQFKEAKIKDKTIDSIVKTASEKEEDGSYRYAYAAVSEEDKKEKQTPLTKDTLITLTYEQVYNKTTYSGTGSDGAAAVTAVLEKKDAVPDNAVLEVTAVTGGNGYNYDAYMSALNSLSKVVPHSSYNTLLYDIAFMVPETDEVGKETGKMIEYQPEAGSVSIQMTFNGNQLSGQLGAADPAYVEVTHLALSDQVRDKVDSTAAATGISPADINVIPLEADIRLDGSTDSAAFSVKDFSAFAFSYIVDFVFDGYEFDLEGDDSIMLSQMFEQLGIEADAGKAVIAQSSDDSLISIEREDDDWRLTAPAPFKTEETLTVTMADGTRFVIAVTDDITVEVKVRSVDEDGETLAKAGIQILNEDGTAVAEWTSNKSDHVVKDLEPGVEYTLHEEEAPEGYLPAKDSTFVMKEDGAIDLQRTTAAVQNGVLLLAGDPDITVTVRKVDEEDKPLEGAEFSLLTEGETEPVDQWTSSEEDHVINELTAGEYTLKETKTPDGCIPAADTTFAVNESGELENLSGENAALDEEGILKIKNIQTGISVRKVDGLGKPLSGAALQIVDAQGETVIPEWTSGEEDYQIKGLLNIGVDYILKETKAPEGYLLAEDIKFVLNDDGSITVDPDSILKDPVLIMTDRPEEAKGSITLEGMQYIDTYVYDLSTGRQQRKDKPLTKDDIFTYEIQEIEGDKVINTWTIQNDADGWINYPTFTYVRNNDRDDTGAHIYTIRETSASRDGITPDDFIYRIEVNVKDVGSEQLQVNVSGVDDYRYIDFFNTYAATGTLVLKAGKSLAGLNLRAGAFQFEVVSEEGRVITKAANAADGSVTFPGIVFQQGLDGTYNYRIREVVPKGVNKKHPFKGGVYYDTRTHKAEVTAKDDGKGKMVISVVYDGKSSKKIPTFVNYVVPVRVRKLSSSTGNYVYGARMQLKAGSKVLETWTSSKYEYLLYGLDPGVTYTLHEVSAPKGYNVAKDTTFTLAADGTILKSKTTAAITSDGALVVYDSLTPKTTNGGTTIGRRGPIVNYETGDDTPIALYVGLLAAAAVLVILLLILRRRKRK